MQSHAVTSHLSSKIFGAPNQVRQTNSFRRASQPLGFRKLAGKPLFAKTWVEDDFPLSKPESSGFWWSPYPMSLQTQRSLKVELREVDVTLAEIAEEALEFITPDENSRPATEHPTRALELYDAVIRWQYSLPDRIRFEEAALPSTILVQSVCLQYL